MSKNALEVHKYPTNTQSYWSWTTENICIAKRKKQTFQFFVLAIKLNYNADSCSPNVGWLAGWLSRFFFLNNFRSMKSSKFLSFFSLGFSEFNQTEQIFFDKKHIVCMYCVFGVYISLAHSLLCSAKFNFLFCSAMLELEISGKKSWLLPWNEQCKYLSSSCRLYTSTIGCHYTTYSLKHKHKHTHTHLTWVFHA